MQTLDLRGVSCPTNFIKIKLALEMIDPGETVEILLDDGEPVKNVPPSLTAEGHRLLGLERKDDYYVLKVKNTPRPTGPVDSIRDYSSTKITRQGSEPATDPVMVEETIDLIVNGTKLSSIVTTPDLHKELAVGYLITEGAIKIRADIEAIEEKGTWVMLQIRSFDHFNLWHELRSSGCIGINWERHDEDVKLPIQQKFKVDVLLESMKYLYDETQDRTGGAHTASLVAANGTLKYKALDIGRHNAIDKVVGMAVLNGDDLSKMFLISSGRQPAGMVMKAARAGIPLVISKAAPVSSGIDSARRSNVTLCCFATSEKMKVFSVPDRIVT
jgi:FdhD protein